MRSPHTPAPRIALAAAAIATLALTLVLFAGPLNPPGGPVGSTYKTLSEVEPRTAINAANTPGDADSLFKITQPGSYYLTGNIAGVASKHGIEIASSGVTLDLNGFELLGVAGSLDGVNVTVPLLENIAVLNGSVRGWGDEGVDLRTAISSNCRVAHLLASDNAGHGIQAGETCIVSDCAALMNGGDGIFTNNGCMVFHCSASGNGGNGISASLGGTVADCNTQANVVDGIRCTRECVIRHNACSLNGSGGDGAGIHTLLGDNRIEANNCTGADRGIDVDAAGNVILKNTCSGNAVNWVIAANNVYGTIVDRTAPASAAVNGNAAASSLGTTDANANFSY